MVTKSKSISAISNRKADKRGSGKKITTTPPTKKIVNLMQELEEEDRPRTDAPKELSANDQAGDNGEEEEEEEIEEISEEEDDAQVATTPNAKAATARFV